MKARFFILVSCIASLLLSSTSAAEGERPAYVERFFAKHSWKVFEACMVVGYYDGAREIDVKRVKEKNVFVSHVPTLARVLVVEAMTSPDSIFKSFGGRRFRMEAGLKAGERYRMNLVRAEQRVEVWISDAEGAVVSQKLSFDIEHPFVKPPLIIPIL